MNNHQDIYDFLLIGQGLAGSTLADLLMQNGYSVLVIDRNETGTSSKIAAGIINPIVFKRLTLSWKVNTLLPFAKNYYHNIESQTKEKLLFSITIYRIFSNENEYNFWEQQCNEPHLIDYLSEPEKGKFNPHFETPYGYGKVLQAGFLDTKKYIAFIRGKLLAQNSYIEHSFNYNDLKVESNKIHYNNIRAKKIIFCQGWEDAKNPFFKHLDIFKLTKGEVLTVQPENNIDFEEEISKGIFFLKHIDHYKIGATYNWEDLTPTPTEKAKNSLLEKFNTFSKFNVNIIHHLAGIRPTVKDRRPVIGFLSNKPQIGIFNGLGTKGVMIAPWLASHFLDHLKNNKPIDKEININRFEKL